MDPKGLPGKAGTFLVWIPGGRPSPGLQKQPSPERMQAGALVPEAASVLGVVAGADPDFRSLQGRPGRRTLNSWAPMCHCSTLPPCPACPWDGGRKLRLS